MRLVVADTSPINYLILIGQIDLLHNLFEKVVIPEAVCRELQSERTPPSVRRWMENPPAWLEVHEVPPGEFEDDEALAHIDRGERAAIQLARVLKADLLLIDDRKAVEAAERKGFRVTGTLGVLDLAAERGLIDFAGAITALDSTNFRKPIAVLAALLKKHTRRET